MRYLPIALALFSCVCLTAQAQQAPAFTFGLKSGASLAGLANRNLQSSHYLWGLYTGLTGNYILAHGFSLQAEALYSQKGVGDDVRAGGVTYAQRLRLHYLDLPMLVRFRAQGGYFEVGPQLGVLLSARDHSELPGYGASDETVTDGFHRVDLGLVSSIGYQLANGLGIGLRTNAGLLNVPKNNYSGTAVRNNAFQLYLTYQLTRQR